MKYILSIFFLFFLITNANAESSYQAKCVNSYYLTSSGTTHRINVVYSHTPSTVNVLTYSTSIITELVTNNNKFAFDSSTQRCNAILESSTLYYGLSEKDFNYAMAIYGIFLSSIIAYGLVKAF